MNLRIKYTFGGRGRIVLLFFFPPLAKVREDQDRERAEPVFLFSHSVLLKGCLTEREQLLKKGQIKSSLFLGQGFKAFSANSMPVLRFPNLLGLQTGVQGTSWSVYLSVGSIPGSKTPGILPSPEPERGSPFRGPRQAVMPVRGKFQLHHFLTV